MTKKMVTLEEWYVEFSKMATSEILRLIEDEKQELGDFTEPKFQQQFIATFIGKIVYLSLVNVGIQAKKETKQIQYKVSLRAFQDMKTMVQDAVAAGFQAAMKTYGKQEIEYYCQIKTVPKAVNSEPC